VIEVTSLPPMLARLQPMTVVAIDPVFRLVADLRTQVAWLGWLCANDPDEPKLTLTVAS
jgi:hypothetical protein